MSIFPSSSALSSHFVNPRRQLPSKKLSLAPSRTPHDAAWLPFYASLLCLSKEHLTHILHIYNLTQFTILACTQCPSTPHDLFTCSIFLPLDLRPALCLLLDRYRTSREGTLVSTTCRTLGYVCPSGCYVARDMPRSTSTALQSHVWHALPPTFPTAVSPSPTYGSLLQCSVGLAEEEGEYAAAHTLVSGCRRGCRV